MRGCVDVTLFSLGFGLFFCVLCCCRRREDEAARAKRTEQEENRRRMEAERKRLQDAVAPYTEKVSESTSCCLFLQT